LSLWGAAIAPFARLESASFVIVCALALAVAITVAAWRFVYRRLSRRQARPSA
jgi:membrane protein implicated in regulation of membrane protease activity